MFEVKTKTETIDKTITSAQTHQKRDKSSHRDSKSQKRNVSKNQKPIKQSKDKVNHLFPGWAVTKAITSQKTQQFYRGQPYVRQIEPTCHSRQTVQLTEEDLIFIKTNRAKFIYQDVEILNQYILRQFLQFLQDSKKQDESVENIRLIFRNWTQSQDMFISFPFCSAFLVQSPQKFEQFALLISQHCRYNFIKHAQFQTNAYYYKFKLFKDRQLYSSQKKSRKTTNSVQNAKNQQKKQRELLQRQLQKYSDLQSHYLKDKQQLFKNIKNVFLVLKDIGYCDATEIKIDTHDCTLESVHKTLFNLLNKHQQKEFDELGEKQKPQSNRKQHPSSQKKK